MTSPIIQPCSVFQSTLPHGSDRLSTDYLCWRFKFQSTLPHGSDMLSIKELSVDGEISIHAPSRERPHVGLRFICATSDFNPRSLTGATASIGAPHAMPPNFNPRSLTGATVPRAHSGTIPGHFNPRSLTGATCRSATCRRGAQFQSTLPHGSDCNTSTYGGKLTEFQSTLPHGSDL